MNYKPYPLLMRPAFKGYIWGGTKLKSAYHKESDLPIIAESWEVSTHTDGLSVVKNGRFAGQTLKAVLEQLPEWSGQNCQNTAELPILIKLIDAEQNLSLQVHPTDEYARTVENQAGKNEVWYIAEAEPGAQLILGFKKPLSKSELREAIESGDILSVVRRVSVEAGDCYIIPAGLLHSIGKGIVIVEVQQASNVTYRVYDYGRLDNRGNSRELHIDKALDVIDTSIEACKAESNILTDWEHFRCELLTVDMRLDRCCGDDSFECLTVAGITCRDDYQSPESSIVTLKYKGGESTLKKGDTVFIPAGLGEYTLMANDDRATVICTAV